MRLRLLAASWCVLLHACSCQPSMATDAGVDAGTDGGLAYDEFDAWREMQAVVGQSPDALPTRAAALVAAKDLEGLLRLVRDDIAMVPPEVGNFDVATTRIRWGARATLRGQYGTPRERADLLAELYVRAGFEAEVVTGRVAPEYETPDSGVAAMLARAPRRTIVYDAGTDELARWAAVLAPQKTPPGGFPSRLDPGDVTRQEVLAQVKPLAPMAPAPEVFSASMRAVPLVKVTVEGQVKYANPNLPGVPFGESGTTAEPAEAFAAGGEHFVSVRLLASKSTRPNERFVLAERRWKASEVAGRTITAAFTTPLSRLDAARTKVRDAQTFIPMLVVRGDGLDADAGRALSVVGTAVTREGEVLELADGGVLVVDGEPLPKGPTPEATLAKVATVEAGATAGAYPNVELSVSARTSSGDRVSGLAADAFAVTEDGQKVVGALRKAKALPPKVVLLFDRSTSLPPEFLSGAAAVGKDIATQVFAQFPGAQVQVAGIGINAPVVAGPFVGTLPEVESQLSRLSGVGSEIWVSLAGFIDSGADCVVLVSDMQADDMPSPEQLTRLSQGPAALVAGVGTVDAMIAARVAEVTGGRVLSTVTAEGLATQVVAYLNELQRYDYRIVYRSNGTGTAARQVKVSLKSPSMASATTSYTPPTTPAKPDALSALWLEIGTDANGVTRRLAGSAQATPQDVEETFGALFGRWVIAIEAGAPSFSTLFHEHLGERLRLEPAVDALRSGDPARIRAQAEVGAAFRVPAQVRFLASALPAEKDARDFTWVDGITAIVHASRPVLGVKVVSSVDVVPLGPWRTTDLSGASGFERTLERTARLAAAEARRYPKSTLALLKGETLAKYDPNFIDLDLGAKWSGVTADYKNCDILAPRDGSPVAFWAVNRETGALIGGLPNGTGGGEGESTAALVERLQAILDAVARAGEAAGYEGVAVWAELESTKVGLLGNAIAILEGEPSVDPAAAVANAVCGGLAGALAGEVPGLSDLEDAFGDLSSIERLVHMGTGMDAPPHPSPSEAFCGALGF